MRIEPECAVCIIHRGYQQIAAATNDKETQFKALRALFKFLSEKFSSEATPAWIGTQRDRIIKAITGNPDPYAERKNLSNKKALEFLPIAELIINNSANKKERFRKACLCAIVGNIMEFDIPGHEFDYSKLKDLIANAEEELVIDEIDEIYELAEKAEEVMYLTDNAGEIVFDTLLVRELKNIGCEVTVAVKGGPVLNDATLADARFVGMDKIADSVITTGTDAVGLQPQECSKEFLEAYSKADFVIAKGMGYAETLTELDLKIPHALLFRTKCNPVARHFGVERNRNVAIILPKG
ncbi:hypothetical protein DRO54_04365 [Candidatus Bathyarchaeota archaeon]|nr:MAG: hypothetical protein DRO54_04365 [Candidatus Bathyarchaeota archaeon]